MGEDLYLGQVRAGWDTLKVEFKDDGQIKGEMDRQENVLDYVQKSITTARQLGCEPNVRRFFQEILKPLTDGIEEKIKELEWVLEKIESNG